MLPRKQLLDKQSQSALSALGAMAAGAGAAGVVMYLLLLRASMRAQAALGSKAFEIDDAYSDAKKFPHLFGQHFNAVQDSERPQPNAGRPKSDTAGGGGDKQAVASASLFAGFANSLHGGFDDEQAPAGLS